MTGRWLGPDQGQLRRSSWKQHRTDPGFLDTHTSIWDWGDGTTSAGTVIESNGSGAVSGSHTYAAAGIYTIKITVTDDDAGVGVVTARVSVEVPATPDFDPDTLNLGSKGTYVTVYIELPTGYDVKQIDISSIRLNDTVSALAKPTAIGDYDKDGKRDLMVKFDRAAVQKLLSPGNQVEITITGKVAGLDFRGSDTIRVIKGGGVATAGVSNIPYLGYILAGLLGCFVIATGMVTFFMWGRPLPTRD